MAIAFSLLILYAAGVTWLVVRLYARASKSDEYRSALSESEHARNREKEMYYAHNLAWQKEVDVLKGIIHNLRADLNACRQRLHKGREDHASDDSGATGTP